MILITGATGTVGSEVVRELSARGAEVRAVVRDPHKAEKISLPHVEVLEGDFDHPETMEAACAGVKRAFLLTSSSERTEAQQIAFTRAAQRNGVGHVVKLSQLGADVSSTGRFQRYHAAVEGRVPGFWGRVYVSPPQPVHAGAVKLPADDREPKRVFCGGRRCAGQRDRRPRPRGGGRGGADGTRA